MALRPDEEVDDGYTRESFEQSDTEGDDDSGDEEWPTPAKERLQVKAEELVLFAQDCGMVVTIDLKPRLPLAMGNYDMVISVRPAR